MDPHQEIANTLADMAHLTVKSRDGNCFSLFKGEEDWGRILVVIWTPADGQVAVPLEDAIRMRDHSQKGLASRIAFAAPEGVMVKTMGPELIDGWIGMEDERFWVYFGELTIHANPNNNPDEFLTFDEEETPMRWVSETKAQWLGEIK